MKTRLLTLVAPLLLLSLVFIPQTALAKEKAPHRPLSTCSGSGCEGLKPPPVGPTNCTTEGSLSVKGIWDSVGTKIGELNLFTNNTTDIGCSTAWGAVKSILPLNVQEVRIREGSGGCSPALDSSEYGGIDGDGHDLGENQWESTFMDYWPGCSGGHDCMHSYSDIKDSYGVDIITNTDTWCR